MLHQSLILTDPMLYEESIQGTGCGIKVVLLLFTILGLGFAKLLSSIPYHREAVQQLLAQSNPCRVCHGCKGTPRVATVRRLRGAYEERLKKTRRGAQSEAQGGWRPPHMRQSGGTGGYPSENSRDNTQMPMLQQSPSTQTKSWVTHLHPHLKDLKIDGVQKTSRSQSLAPPASSALPPIPKPQLPPTTAEECGSTTAVLAKGHTQPLAVSQPIPQVQSHNPSVPPKMPSFSATAPPLLSSGSFDAAAGRGAAARKVDKAAVGEPPKCKGEMLWDFNEALASGPIPRASVAQQATRFPSTSPALEIQRSSLMADLREHWGELCQRLLCLKKPPKAALDRWLLEQLAQADSTGGDAIDPLLPKPRLALSSRVLFRELLAEVPYRINKGRGSYSAREALQNYHANGMCWLCILGVRPDAAKTLPELRVELEALGTWLSERPWLSEPNRTGCPYQEKLRQLSAGVVRRFEPLIKCLVDKVIGSLTEAAEAMVRELNQDTGGCDGHTGVLVEEHPEKSATVLSYKKDKMLLSTAHFQKLRSLYALRQPCPAAAPQAKAWEDRFLCHLYVMLRRHATFMGVDFAKEGQSAASAGMHCSISESVFGWLKRELGVHGELFSSPLNCYFPRYCSPFPDVDTPFSSAGSFFDRNVDLEEGSYQVNPPFTEEIQEMTTSRILELLKASGNRPLSFIMFLPDWADAAAMIMLDGDEFARFRR
eukprot:gnl/TRDRNA2_/TRDRNA2_156168_c1_seq1.p1 gnl/TRDRNA2_/TRDRNA2_156168_c1~~gnl/TRDRNA2_/TRDRNA2_156168_c1_seq1.p1  ORF type:complete len:711 (+),score=67.50 gnl/TRDRNA2_/TRDRNA2_156168_c1_seq1:145-2277(+)